VGDGRPGAGSWDLAITGAKFGKESRYKRHLAAGFGIFKDEQLLDWEIRLMQLTTWRGKRARITAER
jgi:hypothetical protein